MKTDFKLLLSKLSENDFDFIVIGGFAAAAYGSSFVTSDLDVCAILTSDNIEKLRKAFCDIHPLHRIATNKPSFLDTPKSIEGINNLYLQTDAGILDLISNVTGVGDFEELSKSCIEIKIYGYKCKMISIEDLIKAKLALKRPKDLEVARELETIHKKSDIKSVPTFYTDRLILKAVRIQDTPSYKKYFVNYAVISQLSSSVPWPYPDDGVEWFLNNVILPNQGKDRWVWGIFLKEKPDELIGVVDLWRKGVPEHRGFWLGEPFWGKGLMTEAVEPITAFAFNQLGFEELILSNALGNLKSRRIKEKAGAEMIGIREAQFVDPNLTQAETWRLTKDNWLKSKKTSKS
jgi:RimJ/RimL family protein N-acetyltransferase/predicted nucleotidyltransferase